MSDVFISYARTDEPLAARVGEALQAAGYEVWRDAELPVHRAYSEVIEERLRGAKAVVVLWSAEAARSQWVRAEADSARGLGTLVQARVDPTMPPLPFNQIQCADLSDWAGDSGHVGWRKLTASLEALTGRVEDGTSSSPPRRAGASICVLPFANMSGDPEQEYFSDGISEDITTDLSKVSALEVIARNTAFQFKGHSVDVCDVARRLGVSHVLEGSVRKAGGRVRITAQLIDGASGGHLWAERYDRDLTDIFAVQDEITKEIVAALRLKLLPQEKKALEQRGTANAEAYNLYLMARQYWIADFGNRHRAAMVIRICERATAVDPDYAQAWALMAIAQAHVCYGFGTDPSVDDGSAAADRALALDPEIAEAHLPKAWRLAEQDRFAEAQAEIETALRLNPVSWEVNKEAARIFYRQSRIEEAAHYLSRATEQMDADFHGWGMLLACFIAQGDPAGAEKSADKIIGHVEKILAHDPDNGVALAMGANSFAVLGHADRAREWRERALLLDPDNLFMRYNLAFGLAAIDGDGEVALDILEPVLTRGGPSTIRLAANDPNLDSLRDDPRFQHMLAAALERVGVTRGAG